MISRAGFLKGMVTALVGGRVAQAQKATRSETPSAQVPQIVSVVDYENVRSLGTTHALLADRDQIFVQESGKIGAFYYDAADTATQDDNGTILVDTLGRRFKRLFQGDYFADWWGYRRDNSAASSGSNAKALNEAITAVHALGGGVLNIGFGTAQIREPIVHRSRVALCGTGMGASQILVDAVHWRGKPGDAIIANAQHDGSEEDMVFRDFTLNGGGLNVPGGGAHGIRLALVWRVGVYRLHFIDLENGTALVGCNSQTTMDCKFTLNAGRSANAAFDHWGGAAVVKVSGCVVSVAPGASISQGIQVTGAGTNPQTDAAYSTDIQIYSNSLYGIRSRVSPNAASAVIINALDDKSSAMRSIVTSNYVYDSDMPYVVSGRGGIHTFGLNTAEKCSNGGFQAGPDDTIAPDGVALIGHKAVDCASLTGAILNLNGGTGHSLKACTVSGGTYEFAARINGESWTAETDGLRPGSRGVLDSSNSADATIDGTRNLTFDPVLTLGGAADGIKGAMTGRCVATGNLVFVELSIALSEMPPSAAGAVAIEGFPFNDKGSPSFPVAGTLVYDVENFSGIEGRQLIGRLDGQRRLVLRLADGAQSADVTAANLTARTRMNISFSYIARTD